MKVTSTAVHNRCAALAQPPVSVATGTVADYSTSGPHSAELHLRPDGTYLTGQNPVSREVAIAPGIAQVVDKHLSRKCPLGYAMESAIAHIEDHLEHQSKHINRNHILSRSAAVWEVAAAAGAANQRTLRREDVEHVFLRQVAVASGRPASSEGLPISHEFVASLLILREMMHHLQIDEICLEH